MIPRPVCRRGFLGFAVWLIAGSLIPLLGIAIKGIPLILTVAGVGCFLSGLVVFFRHPFHSPTRRSIPNIALGLWLAVICGGVAWLVFLRDPFPSLEPLPRPSDRTMARVPLTIRMSHKQVTLNRQTRTVHSPLGVPLRVEVPPGCNRLLLGYALRHNDAQIVSIVVRRTDGAINQEVFRIRVHPTPGLPEWQDAFVELPEGTRQVEIVTEPQEAKDLLLARPALLRGRKDAEPRNIILISIDTLRADYLTAHGYDAYPTSPNMDAIADKGTRFEWAIAPSPWTVPSHMTMMTGKDPDALGMDKHIDKTPRLSAYHATLAELFSEAGFLSIAFTGTAAMAGRHGFADGFYLYQEAYNRSHNSLQADLETNVYLALQWLRRNPHQPIFLFFHTFEVHFPYNHARFLTMNLRSKSAEERRAAYASGIAYTDEHLVRFIQELENLSLLENSLLVITSDHGEGLLDHPPLLQHGWTLYDEILHVPLILVGPDIPAGKTIPHQVPLVDLFATLLDYFGLPIPEDVPSRSLRSLIEGSDTAPRPAYSCCMARKGQQYGLRINGYKYVLESEEGADPPFVEKLFDLRSDPAERKNLAGILRAKTSRLHALLIQQMDRNRADAGEIEESSISEDYRKQLIALGYME